MTPEQIVEKEVYYNVSLLIHELEKKHEYLDDLDDGELQELGDDLNIEPYTIEALEHWIVSDYLARRLEEHGEMVIFDFLGLTIWGRTTSGQVIYTDGVIKQIAQ